MRIRQCSCIQKLQFVSQRPKVVVNVTGVWLDWTWYDAYEVYIYFFLLEDG